MSDDDDRLLSRIYEAGAVPELWPDVLKELDGLMGAAGSALLAVRGTSMNWIASPGIDDLVAGYVEAGYVGRDHRTERLIAADHAGFLTETDVFDKAEWENDPIRREYWEPRGYGWGVATHIAVPNGDALIFHGERRLADGPAERPAIERLDRLRPHLARAAMLTNRLSFERIQATVAALEVIGLPAAVLDSRGQALATNSLLESLVPDVVRAGATRLGLAQPAADQLLAQGIASLAGQQTAGAFSIPLPGADGHGPTVAHLHPVRGAARDVFSRASAILVMTPVGGGGVPSEAVIRGLFDLTAAEARVARGLASGLDVPGIARQNGTQIATVRNQIRAIYAKTGVRRQAEFVGLLRGLGTGPSDGN